MLVSNPLRKKGGIFIKKIKFFLMIIFGMFLFSNINVHAESAYFYEGEYIDGIYMNKYQYSTKKTFYQKARFFRKTDTDEYAYCIEPFQFFNEGTQYESTITPYNLTESQKDRISKIAYFGYGYGTHTSTKWYAITQFMIWQASDQTGDYYFTDSLNGNRVDYFSEEINEINYLIDNYNKLPSIAGKEFTTVEGWDLTIEDYNNALSNYQSNQKELVLEGNYIKLNKPKTGEYNYTLIRRENKRKKPIIFYQASKSQNIMKTGDLTDILINFKVKVVKTSINITKIDKDTMSITPSGEAILNGAKYMLYDQNMNEIKELEIQNNQATIENIYFGKYYLKEIKAGTGYTLDNKVYEINIDNSNNAVDLSLQNEVIKKKITINKQYGENNSFHNEENIEFEIYDKNNNIIETIRTNEFGIAEIILPYGEYTIIQKNTTEGYHKVEPFKINVEDIEDEVIELKDYKIPVPDTNTNILLQMLLSIFKCLLIIIC